MKLNFNWFFVGSATASYLLGVMIASWSGRSINFMNLASGLIIFYAFYLLQEVQRFLTSNRVNPFTRLKSGGQNHASLALTLIFGSFLLISAGLYLLLRSEVLIGTNLLLLTALAIVMFLSMGRFSRLWFNSISWFFEGLIVSPIMFLLGSEIQEFQFSYLLFLLWLPIFFLYGASAITLLFSDYDQSKVARSSSFIASVGWEKALKFYHVLTFLTYFSLLIYLATSNTWSSNWPTLLLAVISGAEVFLLQQMAGGMRPNWQLLRALAIVQFFSLLYLLAYALLTK